MNALADVPRRYLHLGVNDPAGAWGVTAELAKLLPATVPTGRRNRIAAEAVAAAVTAILAAEEPS